MSKNKIFWICLFGLFYPQEVTAVRITNLDVPKSAWNPVNLNCKYILEEGENLYAVKWYKDGEEFYRCLANGTIQQFPLKDIMVYSMGGFQKGSCVFELTALTPKSGGEYTCEVSLEWPTFKTVKATAHLDITEPLRHMQPEETTVGVLTLSVANNAGSTGSLHLTSAMSVYTTFVIYYFF